MIQCVVVPKPYGMLVLFVERTLEGSLLSFGPLGSGPTSTVQSLKTESLDLDCAQVFRTLSNTHAYLSLDAVRERLCLTRQEILRESALTKGNLRCAVRLTVTDALSYTLYHYDCIGRRDNTPPGNRRDPAHFSGRAAAVARTRNFLLIFGPRASAGSRG